jgi:hypothetical protein
VHFYGIISHRFVDQEKRKRASVEEEVQYLVEIMAELKINAISQV